MKQLIIALFLLIALTVDVPADSEPVEVKASYSKYKVSVDASNDIREPTRCGLTDSQINHNAVARMMRRTVPYVNDCNVIYIINK